MIERARLWIFRAAVVFLSLTAAGWSQISNLDRGRAEDMLKTLASDVRKHYYDPKFHGLDWDAKVAEAKEKIAKSQSMNMALSHIAAALDTLNDSHTFFLPPEHSYRHDYGLQYQMVGNRCFVTRVRPNRDAAAKGVQPGDEILTLNGYNVNRDDVWKIGYVFSILRPQPSMQLVLQGPSGSPRQVEFAAQIRQGKKLTDLTWSGGSNNIFDLIREGETNAHRLRARYWEAGANLGVLKIPEFDFSPVEVAEMIAKARKHDNLIIDLRGNPGGTDETLKFLLGGLFDKEVKIGDWVGRKGNKTAVTKTMHNPYSGKLIVLLDSDSASASELFARVVQLQKRGTVMGDHSSGSVMVAEHYSEQTGTDTAVFYGASITEYDILMTDGKSLEHTGVVPDELVLPAAEDLAKGRDPVLAHAAESMGVKLSPEDAAKAFPYEWPPE
jgi:carboxyl-terminal processing protease